MSSTSPDQTCPTPRGSPEPTSSRTNSGSMQRDSEQLSPDEPSPVGLLFSDSEEEGVRQIRVVDGGSRSQLARVDVHVVPADGVVDTAADIIMDGKLFALVASTARLKKKNLKKPDKVPETTMAESSGWMPVLIWILHSKARHSPLLFTLR